MSFGLKNAPATFQRFIHEVLRGLDFVFPYLDDILIASKSNQEHEIHLNLVLERLNTFGLRINISKSVFAVEEIEFLGYLITPQGSRPLPNKVQAIMNYKRPENIQDLRTFLGILNFYRRYLKDAAKNQALLHEYLKDAQIQQRPQWPSGKSRFGAGEFRFETIPPEKIRMIWGLLHAKSLRSGQTSIPFLCSGSLERGYSQLRCRPRHLTK
ncbi:Transposon Ty3-G Gag-Pol polyprotein [Araneus ventricosus]|uniref:Transposon Ty3-G Gag-Pol polyprotein n=1 Tax=Araneus ventricosus TaxID=182803 RepID=A0A4Y2Q3B3_ARAVE|nr:Transposon Ty3-G Gag-Pol polyprotein [Araneus ventricosus]